MGFFNVKTIFFIILNSKMISLHNIPLIYRVSTLGKQGKEGKYGLIALLTNQNTLRNHNIEKIQ